MQGSFYSSICGSCINVFYLSQMWGKMAEDEEEKPVDGEESEESEDGEGKGGKAPSKFTLKKIIIFAVLLLLIFGGGAGAYFMGYFDSFFPAKEVNCKTIEAGDEKFDECALILAAEVDNAPGVFIDVPDMIVNLTGSSRQPRFLKVLIKVEVATEEDKKIFEPLLPRVIDQFQMYLRELRIEDLKGTSGVYRMKLELLSRIRAVVPNAHVRDVLFQEILVQ